MSGVYVFQRLVDGAVKIGWSTSIEGRFKTLKTACPDLVWLADTDGAGDSETEQNAHWHLKRHGIGGEWFSWCNDVKCWMLSHCVIRKHSSYLPAASAEIGGDGDTVFDNWWRNHCVRDGASICATDAVGDGRLLVSAERAAAMLSLTPSAMVHLDRTRRLPAVVICGKRRWRTKDIRAYLDGLSMRRV